MPISEQFWREFDRGSIASLEIVRTRLEKEFAARNLLEWCTVLLGILADRFGPPPVLLVIFIEACEDLDLLRKLTRQAGSAASLDAFQL